MATKQIDERPFGMKRAATPAGRKFIEEFLAAAVADDGVHGNLELLYQRLFSVAEDAMPALAEALDNESPEKRLRAALMIRCIADVRPGLTFKGAYERSGSIVTDALAGDDAMLQGLACLVLGTAGSIDDFKLLLRKLVTQRIGSNSVLAAGALVRDEEAEPEATQLLLAALNDDNISLAGMAGAALLPLKIDFNKTMSVVGGRLGQMGVAVQTQILMQITALRTDAAPLFDSVQAILNDDEADPGVRYEAACALGSICRGSSKAAGHLLKALHSPNWRIVTGAVEGLDNSGHFPPEAADLLAKRLDRGGKDVRMAAARGLRTMGERAAAKTPALIKHLREERDLDVCKWIAEALVSIGAPAVPSLILLVQEGDVVRAECAMRSLANIGADAAKTLAEQLPKITNERARKMLVVVLAEMGPNAAPAVPVLAEILDETLDDHLALYAVMALGGCGAVASPAIPALIRCLARRDADDDQVAMMIGRILVQLRDYAIPELQDALSGSVGAERDIIERTLAILEGGSSKWVHLDDLQSDDLIAEFTVVGDVLEKEHGATSWRDMAAIIQEKLRQGALIYTDFAMSPNSLGSHVKDLETLLKYRLTTHENKKKGDLTPRGRRFLAEAKEYLRLKALRRKRPGR